MPVFQTGNPLWDQGLNAGASGLAGIFDPSNAARAGLYGAETGKTIQEAQKLREEADWRARLADAYGLNRTGAPQPAAPTAPPPASPLANTVAPAPAPPMAPMQGPTAAGPPITADTSLPGLVAPGPTQGAAPGQPAGPATATPAASAPLTPVPGHIASMSTPQLIALSLLAGKAAPETSLLARAELNNRVTTGQFHGDIAAANRELSGLGDSQPLQSATTITTTGMNNANTLANTVLQGQNTLANTTRTAEEARTTADQEIMSVVPKGQTTAVPVTKGYIKAHPDQFEAYDSARAIAGDVPRAASSVPGDTTAPPVMTPTRDITGKTPYDEAQARDDTKAVNIITPDGKLQGTTVGAYRRNPAMGRPATQQDEQYIRVSPTPGAAPVVVPQGTAGGARPLPTSTDAGAAETLSRAQAAGEAKDQPLAETIIGSAQDAAAGVSSRTPVSVADEEKSRVMAANHFNQLYPVGSGWSPLSSTAPVMPDAATQAYHDQLTTALQRTSYRTNPGAAGIEAWDQMRREGILPTTIQDKRRIGVNPTGAYTDLVSVGKDKAGKDQTRLQIHGDFSRVAKDAAGNPIVQGVGGPRMPNLTTGAPPPATPTASPGSAAAASATPAGDAAPPGAVDGQTVTNRVTGAKGVVRGGRVQTLASAAPATSTPEAVSPVDQGPAPPASGPLADLFSAPARWVGGRMAPRPAKPRSSANPPMGPGP